MLDGLRNSNQDALASLTPDNEEPLNNEQMPINDAGEGSSAPLNSSGVQNNELFNPQAVA